MALPKQVDPIKLARQEAKISGELFLKDCPRLQAIADQKNAVVLVELQFFKDEFGKYVIAGCCDAKVQLVCQRCNNIVEKQVVADVYLCPVLSESQAKNLPVDYDPLVTSGDMVSMAELVEDELLLALPMAPTHAEGACPVDLPDYLV